MPSATIDAKIDAFSAPLGTSQAAPEGTFRNVGDPYHELGKSMLFSGYLMTKSAYSAKKESAKKFFDAMKEALDETRLKANEDETYEIASKYCKTPAVSISRTNQVIYTTTVSMEALKTSANLLLDAKKIDKLPDLEGMVADFARVD